MNENSACQSALSWLVMRIRGTSFRVLGRIARSATWPFFQTRTQAIAIHPTMGVLFRFYRHRTSEGRTVGTDQTQNWSHRTSLNTKKRYAVSLAKISFLLAR